MLGSAKRFDHVSWSSTAAVGQVLRRRGQTSHGPQILSGCSTKVSRSNDNATDSNVA